jgi:hypothetical protein
VACLRIQADPNDVTALGHVRHLGLPGLSANRLPRVRLGMPVPPRHLGNERSQRPPRPNCRESQSPFLQRHLDLRCDFQACALRERLGNSYRETVAPLLNLRSHEAHF